MAITATTADSTTSSTLTPTLALGFTAAAGDLILAAIGVDSAVTAIAWPGAWQELNEGTLTGGRGAVGYLIASGGETSIVPTGSGTGERWESVFWRIPTGEWHGTTVPEVGAPATGSSVNPNSASVAPSWGSEANNIFVSVCFRDDSVANTITGYPADFTTAQADKNDLASACNVGGAVRIVTAASIDPAAFTVSASETWRAITIAVRPSGAATFALAGVADGTAAMTGSINHAYGLTGTAASVAAMVGALNHAYGLSGTAAATAAMTGDLSKAFALAGLAEAVASMVGDVTVTSSGFALAGTAAATADMTGNVVIGYTLAGQADAVASAAGALGIGYPLAGQADGTASAAGAVSVGYSLAGMAAAVAAMSGGINHTYGLAGTAAATATLIGDLQSGVIVVGDAAIVFTQLSDGSIAFTVVNLASLAFSSPHEAQLSGMATEYDRGDTTRPTVTFTVSGTATDPTTISLQVISPDKVSTTYTYAAAQITKSGTGVYYRDVSLDQSGVWYFRFSGTGSCAAAAEGTVTVRA